MADKKDYFVVGTWINEGGLEWLCPRCNDTNVDWGGPTNCQYCNTEVLVEEPGDLVEDPLAT